MNKKVIITIITVLIIIGLISSFVTLLIIKNKEKEEVEIKINKNSIYELFRNFPESNNIYYTSKSLYSERSIGPEIYQIDILAELTDEAFDNFINQIEFEDSESFNMRINPHNIKYDWKKIKDIEVIESKDIEEASITSIYLDENKKTIYVIALGGN